MAYEAQGDPKAGGGEEASVLAISDLPNFTEYSRIESGLFEEFDGDFARDDSYAFGICMTEELTIDALLVGSEV